MDRDGMDGRWVNLGVGKMAVPVEAASVTVPVAVVGVGFGIGKRLSLSVGFSFPLAVAAMPMVGMRRCRVSNVGHRHSLLYKAVAFVNHC